MLLRVVALVAAFGSCAAGQTLKGEWGQAVLGCKCYGRKDAHGYCGYHFHWGSNEDQPWCRTQHKCGHSAILGSWMSCDAQAVERRRAQDGTLYNAKQFKEFFKKDGKEKWVGAKEHTEKRLAKDSKPYSVFEFRDFYIDALGEQGWVAEWVKALPEERKADDGKWYTWDEFKDHFGESKVWSTWAA